MEVAETVNGNQETSGNMCDGHDWDFSRSQLIKLLMLIPRSLLLKHILYVGYVTI